MGSYSLGSRLVSWAGALVQSHLSPRFRGSEPLGQTVPLGRQLLLAPHPSHDLGKALADKDFAKAISVLVPAATLRGSCGGV